VDWTLRWRSGEDPAALCREQSHGHADEAPGVAG